MLHGGEFDHEGGGAKIVKRCLLGLCACRQHRVLELGDGNLPIGLTKGDQPNPGGHQIGDITLQEGRQGRASRNALPRRTNSQNEGEDRLNMAFAEYLRKPVQDAIGPYLAQRREAGRRLLRRFKREFRCPTKGGRQFRNFEQLRTIIIRGAARSLAEENRFISSRAIAEICFQPVDETYAVMDVPGFDSSFEAM